MTPPPTHRSPWMAPVALALLIALHLLLVGIQLQRAPDFDEGEYLHAAWLHSQGERLYRDFEEAHPPFLTAMLEALQPVAVSPRYPLLDVPAFLARGRLLMAAFGLVSLGCAGLVAFRLAGSWVAPLILVAAVAGGEWTWLRGLADVRHDPPALAWFWAGALLILWDRRPSRATALRTGAGLGMVATAALWNSKWPLESVVLGLVALRSLWGCARLRPRDLLPAGLAAIPFFALSVVLLLQYVSLSDYSFYVFEFNRALQVDYRKLEWVENFFRHRPNGHYCARPFQGAWPFLALGLLLAARFLPRARAIWSGLDRELAVVVVCLVAAGGLEIRFLYAWPNLWPQYYVMWEVSTAIVYGAMPGAISALWRGYGPMPGSVASSDPPHISRSLPSSDRRALWWGRAGEAGLVLGICVAFIVGSWPRFKPPSDRSYWEGVSWVQRQLRPGETVWLQPYNHPIGVKDASYYWFALTDVVPLSLRYSAAHPGDDRLPPLTDATLPMCRIEQGLEPVVRFVVGAVDTASLPESLACFKRMKLSGQLRKTRVNRIWEVMPAGRWKPAPESLEVESQSPGDRP